MGQSNVTEHFAEAARGAARGRVTVALGTQERLRSMQAAIASATQGGVQLEQRMTVGGLATGVPSGGR